MSTRRTVSSDQLLPPIDTEAEIRAANKAKRIAKQSARDQALAAAALAGPLVPRSSNKEPPVPSTSSGIKIEPPTASSCPASLSSSLTLPTAVGFKTDTASSLFSSNAPDPRSVRAWPIIPPTSIRPPPPPLGPLNPTVLAPPALPPTDKLSATKPTMDTQPPPNSGNPDGPSTTHSATVPATEPPKPTQTLDGPGMIAEMHRMSLQIQQANLDAQRAADARAQAIQRAADERALANAERFA
ncbi:hypothetical protein PTTG_09061 [Puccinia triticina 1-1 BBBD Race 1]|uniref:Uncharacterized protein n=1 Tax=Puccinia triticina (isolate 1-1 / race 1 (BBBD)) TaxID=630390 RepID=A0A0C4F7D2_PUCT1|nr:hypothetical protein PTTG_09061 [Puccinia triticina 1-1 BBBD Race 1]